MTDLDSRSEVVEPTDVPASDYSTWDANYLSTGVFYFPKHEQDGKLVEVALRQALTVHPTWRIADLLDYALERYLHFRILVPAVPLSPHCSPPIELTPHLSGQETGMELVRRWKTRVTSLLTHPRGRAFAFAGGIEAQITAYIGGAAFLEGVKTGPSLSGPTFSHSHNGHVYYDDDLVAEDVDILLGTVAPVHPQTVPRTLWPSTELLASCMEGYNRHTEWNAACEEIFHAVKDEIEGHKPCPRPRALWLRFIKHNGAVRQHVLNGSGALNTSAMLAIHDTFGKDWHGSRLTECTL